MLGRTKTLILWTGYPAWMGCGDSGRMQTQTPTESLNAREKRERRATREKSTASTDSSKGARLATLIEFQDVDLGYGRHAVLRGVSLSVEQGDLFGILGPNGSGKTTLLKGVVQVLRPRKGRIVLANPANAPVLRFGYVPQESRVNPYFPLSAMDVVLMGRTKALGPWRRPGRADRAIARKSLADAGIERLAEVSYQDLSGGQKQRVLIARALAAEPHVLVLDEPTSGLDLVSERELMELIRALLEEDGLTIVIASHNLNWLANDANKIAIVTAGRVEAGGTHEILTEERLSRLYGVPVRVEGVKGKRIVL